LIYTLAITSADRFDLLEQSLVSFMENADVPPAAIVIINDGPAEQPEFVKRYRHIPTTWLQNDQRRGQVYSLDRLYSEVKTEHVFHTEDDFLFTSNVPVRKSFEILEKYPDISLVALRSEWYHPIADAPDHIPSSIKIAMPYWRQAWGGYTWNPGARRLSDIKKFGPVSKYGQQNGLEHEAMLSKAFLDAGYRIAVLPGQQCCQHIGGGRSKASEKIELKDPKILIAVKAGQTLSYTKWESLNSPSYDASIAYNGVPYCKAEKPIHVSGPNPRIAAVRETWMQDAKNIPNVVAKFFFGQPAPAQPMDDEIYLPVADDYASLAPKTKEICRWAYEHDFTYVCLVDDDTLLYVDRLLAELKLYNTIDYAGYQHGDVCSGGAGYILSRKAMHEVINNYHEKWAEDVSVGLTMKQAGIQPVHLEGHRSGKSDHHYFPNGFDASKLDDKLVAAHAVFPDVLRAWYAYKQSVA
jgi:Galactosyltransferase